MRTEKCIVPIVSLDSSLPIWIPAPVPFHQTNKVICSAVIVCHVQSLPTIALPPLHVPLASLGHQGVYFCYQERIYQESFPGLCGSKNQAGMMRNTPATVHLGVSVSSSVD